MKKNARDMQLPPIYRKVFILFRRRRMKTFYAIFSPTAETRILDIGGAPNTWFAESSNDTRFPVTFVNLQFPDIGMLTDSRFSAIEGDATHLHFADASFDLAFSNSVIEHMTTWERQQAFAREARRVATKLWIQTPARSFPLEPHVLAPFFQYLPRRVQTRITRHFTLWGLVTKPTPAQVNEMISDIRLLTYREVKQLFPDCHILKERVFGLTKSYIAVRGH
jgi:hypothetical protein